MQLMPINRYSTIYINSDEALANINVTVNGMLISWQQIFRLFFYIIGIFEMLYRSIK